VITGRDDERPWRVVAGPWDDEPDWAEFEHAGLPIRLMRNGAGAWCGYVHLPSYHPVLQEDVTELGHFWWPFDVHGGITWQGGREFSDGRCLFTLGFDLNHSGDGAPSNFRHYDGLRGEYRDIEYAAAEARTLAEQVSSYKPLEQMANIFSGTSGADDTTSAHKGKEQA
jgi:hypothetical protein